MSHHPEAVECWSCLHDVDEHDVLARCLEPACGCGWERDAHPEERARHRHPHPATRRGTS